MSLVNVGMGGWVGEVSMYLYAIVEEGGKALDYSMGEMDAQDDHGEVEVTLVGGWVGGWVGLWVGDRRTRQF